jgi:hypothetical protein
MSASQHAMKTLKSRDALYPAFVRVSRHEDENEFNFSKLHASEMDQQAAIAFPYAAVIISFCQKDLKRSPHSPTNTRKPVPVNLGFVPAFKAWKFHFVATTAVELIAQLSGYIELELTERKAKWVEIGVCKFFNPHECIMLKAKVKSDGIRVVEQLTNISRDYMTNIERAHKLLMFPPQSN